MKTAHKKSRTAPARAVRPLHGINHKINIIIISRLPMNCKGVA